MMMKKISAVCMCAALLAGQFCPALAIEPVPPAVSSPSLLLMEKQTGRVLYEKDADTPRLPASVTKVMTLLLVMEAIDKGTLRLDEKINISANAQNMGGSQVYLAEGEQYAAEDLIKSVVIASGNDAAVALAEYLAGSEATFVGRMNERAAQLGMSNTHFLDCTGLSDEGHLTSARDIATMSRELLKYPLIKKYTTVWMDSLRDGTFGLNNTNKLIRFYPGATGLKTGSTSRAGFCLSATAERAGMELIAVVMAAGTSAQRFEEAKLLLDFGFANYTIAEAAPAEPLKNVPVLLGKAPEVPTALKQQEFVLVGKGEAKDLVSEVTLTEDVEAPVEAGQVLGELTVKSGDTLLITVPIVAAESVARLSALDIFGQLVRRFFLS